VRVSRAFRARCNFLCRVVRDFPHSPPRLGKKRKLIRRWPLAFLALGAFGLGLFMMHAAFSAGVVIGRVIEAIGDVLLDRGISN
jgi:hypothetical protein